MASHAVAPDSQWTAPLLSRAPATIFMPLTRANTWAVSPFITPMQWATENLAPNYRYGWLSRLREGLASDRAVRSAPLPCHGHRTGATARYYAACMEAARAHIAEHADVPLTQAGEQLMLWMLSGHWCPDARERLGDQLFAACEEVYEHPLYVEVRLMRGPAYLELPLTRRELRE